MKSEYRAIPKIGTGRRSTSVAMRCRLYQTADHLLLIQSTGYTEEYKRIFYRNIRYVMVRKTAGQAWHAVISGLLLAAACLLLATSVPLAFVCLLALPFLVWFVVNVLLGSSCRVYINTDIQTLELPAPRRLRKVPALTGFLRSRTAAASAEPAPVAT